MKKTFLLIAAVVLMTSGNLAQTVTDYDGNIYDTVIIGNQVWLKQNLKVTHYGNGDLIPNVINMTIWGGLTTGARCYYENDSATYDSVYGVLYNWHAVNNINKLCPAGWHVPSDAEWSLVETILGGYTIAGGKMKEEGTAHWSSPNTGATNESRFTGLPGGMRGIYDSFQVLHENGLWWSSTPAGSANAWSRYLYYLNTAVDRNPTPKKLGLSVRCIKDTDVGFPDRNDTGNILLYPNPAKDNIIIETAFESQLSIFNLSAQQLIIRQLTEPKTVIDISNLPGGVYFFRICNDKTTSAAKLIKQ
jgi:uncharacterized protein (TIGR02145 family)